MQLGRKIGFSLLLKNESNQLSKTSCTSRKTKLHQKRLKFTCKCEACSKCISQTNIEVLVHKRWLQKPLQHHAKSRKRPKTYQSQMLFHHSAPNPELCTKKTLLSPNSSCHTKSCRNVAHVHRINGSLYFHNTSTTNKCKPQNNQLRRKRLVHLSRLWTDTQIWSKNQVDHARKGHAGRGGAKE